MHFRITVLIQFLIMSIGYFLTALVFWYDLKSYVFLFGIIPLVVNILIFSHFFLNYLSLLLVSLMVLYILGHPLDYMLYETHFWGVQGILFIFGASAAIIKSTFLPMFLGEKQKWLSRVFSGVDGMTVVFDTHTHKITKVSRAAVKLYGQRRKQMVGSSVTVIHTYDFFEQPPYRFWETLSEGKSWYGFLSTFDKQGAVYEERVVVTPIFDERKTVVAVKKRIVEAICREDYDVSLQTYRQLFYKLPVCSAVVDGNFVIENHNSEFQQKFLLNENTNNLIFNVFPMEIQHKIIHAVEQTLSGKNVSFIAKVEDEKASYVAEFTFLPYKRFDKVSKVFFFLQEIAREVATHTLYKGEKIVLFSLLKAVVTSLHKKESHIRLFSGVMPVIHSEKEIWFRLFTEICCVASSFLSDRVTITCSSSFNKHFFKVSYEGVRADDLAEIFREPSQNQSAYQISTLLTYLNIEPVILPGSKAVLCFTYQE